MSVTTSESFGQFLNGEIPAPGLTIERATPAAKADTKPAVNGETKPAEGETPPEQRTDEHPQKTGDGKPKKSAVEELIETRRERNQYRDEARSTKAQVQTLAEQVNGLTAEITKLKAAAPAVEDKPPKREEFTSDAEYQKAVIEYEVDKRLAEREAENAAAEANRIAAEIETRYRADLAAFEAEHENFSEVTANCSLIFPTALLGEIPALDHPAAVAYYLSSPENAEEAKKLIAVFDRDLKLRRFPSAGMRALGRLDDKLTPGKKPAETATPAKTSSANAPEVSKAPAPIEPLKGTAETAGADPEKMTAAQWRDKRRAEQASARNRKLGR